MNKYLACLLASTVVAQKPEPTEIKLSNAYGKRLEQKYNSKTKCFMEENKFSNPIIHPRESIDISS